MAEKDPRLSHQTLRVLRAFLDQPQGRLAGADICRQTGILPGTLYPVLARLEKAGWLDSAWEEVDPRKVGRPRKRLYKITGHGYNKARPALDELTVGKGRFAWN